MGKDKQTVDDLSVRYASVLAAIWTGSNLGPTILILVAGLGPGQTMGLCLEAREVAAALATDLGSRLVWAGNDSLIIRYSFQTRWETRLKALFRQFRTDFPTRSDNHNTTQRAKSQ